MNLQTLKQLFDDENAVSPVIGVILMVAITVILAAVIGTFVLGLGDQVSNTAPQASFTFDFDEGASGSDSFGNSNPTGTEGILTITHDGGDKIKAERLTLRGATGNADAGFANSNDYNTGSDISAGDSIDIWASNDDTIRVVWESSSGGDTATLGKWTGPNA